MVTLPFHLNSLEPLLNTRGSSVFKVLESTYRLPFTVSALKPDLYNFLKSKLVTFSKVSVTLNILINLSKLFGVSISVSLFEMVISLTNKPTSPTILSNLNSHGNPLHLIFG